MTRMDEIKSSVPNTLPVCISRIFVMLPRNQWLCPVIPSGWNNVANTPNSHQIIISANKNVFE